LNWPQSVPGPLATVVYFSVICGSILGGNCLPDALPDDTIAQLVNGRPSLGKTVHPPILEHSNSSFLDFPYSTVPIVQTVLFDIDQFFVLRPPFSFNIFVGSLGSIDVFTSF
jgi:hypothetical protein